MVKQQYQNLTNLSKIHKMLTITNSFSMTTMKDLPVHNLLSITSYLNEDQLTTLMLALSKCEHFDIWVQIIKNQLLFTQYIDKADKSYYFAIFQHQRYRQLHLNTLHHAGLHNSTLLHNFTNLFQIGIKKLGSSVNKQIKSEFQESVKLLFLDPPMPMPKLLRQTVAPRVCSPLQNFLLSQVQTRSETPSEAVFEALAQNFQNAQQKHLAQIANNRSKYQNLFYNAHKISFRKISSAQLGSPQTEINLYNFLGGLFQMTDLYLSSVEEFLCSLSDQFQLYLQLVARFSVFVAFVIAVQEAFGIIFNGFQALYRQIFQVEDSFSFWKPALSIWLSKMYKFHSKTNKIQQNLTQHLSKLHLQQKLNQQKYIQIFSTFQIQLLSNAESEQQYKNSPFFDILGNDPTQLLILVNSYQQMMMDLSIDEINVLSCGHSMHQIEGVFQEIEASAISEQSFFIEKALKLSVQHHEKKKLINQFLIQRLNHLEQILKPSTHSKIQKHYLRFLEILPVNNSKMVIDYQISRYLCYIEENKGYILERRPKSIWDLSFGPEININYGNKICNAETLDTENQILDNSFQFYESDNQEDISQKVITNNYDGHNFEERLARSQ